MPPESLYTLECSRAARATVLALFGSAVTFWDVERGEGGKLHIHVVSSLPPVAVPDALHVKLLTEEKGGLRGELAYLSKPSDARLCEASRWTPWTPTAEERARRYRLALDDRATALKARLAQGKTRLAPMSGWTGRRADPKSAAVGMRLELAACAAVVAALAFLFVVAASVGALKAGRERRPGTSPARIYAAPSRPAQRRPATCRTPHAHAPPGRMLQGSAF